jgi:hydroxymethylpyrimidine/phosphomethylpyrimidine kinase
MTDRLYCSDGSHHTFVTQRVHSTNLHGTGCTLSSAIATALAQGQSLPDAVATAKQLVTNAIKGGATLHIGGGNGPLWIQ